MADQRTAPGVRDSLGTIPGPMYSPNSGSTWREEHVPRLVLRVFEDVGDRVDRAADDAGLVQRLVDLLRRALARPVADDPLDLVLVVTAREVRRELRVVGELGPADRFAEPAEDVVGVRGDHDPLVVGGLEDVRGSDALQVRALRAADDPEAVVLRHRALEQRERRLHQRDVDDLADATAQRVAPVEGGENAVHGEHAGQGVAERQVHARWRLVGEAVDVADPAHRLRDGGKAGPLSVGAGLPVAGDTREHEAGVDLAEAVVAEIPPLERPGPEVLDHDVCLLGEAKE